MTDVVPVQQAQVLDEPEDRAYRRALSRLSTEAGIIASMPGLKRSIQGKTKEEARANVMAIGLTLLSFGVRPNIVNVNSFHIIEGQAVPSTQFYCGLASAACGHELWIEDDESDETKAVAVLVHATTGREHRVTYTVERARKSKALDFWVERWESGSNGRYCAERLTLGTEEDQAKVAQAAHAEQWVRKAPLKSNPAWHHHRDDMLAIRAVRRALKRGAPEVMAGVASFEKAAMSALPPGVVIDTVIDVDAEDEPDLVDADDEMPTGERPEITIGAGEPYDPVPPEVIERAKVTGRRVMRLRRQFAALPEHVRGDLAIELGARGLPLLDKMTADSLDVVEDLVDEVTARAFSLPPTADESDGGVSGDRKAPVEPGTQPDPVPAQASASAPPSDHPRPLAQQIAMSAQQAGIDHHHVIAAVTAGEKTSAKEVDREEGQLVLQAIQSIAAGEYRLGQGHDGTWRFVDTPKAELFADDDPGRPFTEAD